MTQALLQKRMHLMALAALLALVAAMFVALQSVSAAACVTNPDISLGIGDTCTVTHEDATDADSSSDDVDIATVAVDADGVATITGVAVGTATITIRMADTEADTDTDPDVIATYDVTVSGFGIAKLEVVDDADGIVTAGPQITVRATVRSAEVSTPDSDPPTGPRVRLTVPGTSGMSIEVDSAAGTTSQGQAKVLTSEANDAVNTKTAEFTINTAGAPAGEHTLTFVADPDGDFSTERGDQVSDTLTVEIGEAGLGVSTATLSLGNKTDDTPFTTDDETIPESGTADAKDGKINLVVEVFNALGNKARTGDIDQMTIIAPGGEITTTHNTGAGTPEEPTMASGTASATLNEQDADAADGTADVGDVGQRTVITVGKANDKPGTVSVYAIVSGPGGAATTETIELTFAGSLAAFEVSDAAEALLSVNVDGPDAADDPDEDTIKLKVTATDAGGNSVEPGESGYRVVITGPDGKRVNMNRIAWAQPDKGADGTFTITLTGKGSTATPLKAGEYTATVTRGTLKDTATFVVAGAAANVSVTAEPSSSEMIGDVITITIKVTDADGNAVSDGTVVKVEVSENTGLAAIGTGHPDNDGDGTAKTENGTTSVKYAVVGAGNSVVSATAGGATGVVVVASTAGVVVEEPVVEEPAPEVHDSSGLASQQLNSFTSWTASNSSTASQVFASLAGRGATSIQLWNGSSWLRYSMVDGAMVPGSIDFTIMTGDVIYIGG